MTDFETQTYHQLESRLAATQSELAELRAAVTELLGEQETNCRHATISQVRACPTCAAVVEGYVKLISLAAQPQGDRGRALLAELEQYRELLQAWRAFWRQRHSTNELIAMEPYIGPRTELGMRFAAIDGAQS